MGNAHDLLHARRDQSDPYALAYFLPTQWRVRQFSVLPPEEINVNIILIGAQGSGKGTQAEQLSKALHIPHVASGDLLRKAVDAKTELGMKAKGYMDRGELVPDDLTVAMILSRIKEPDCANGVLLDGFPRTIPQAKELDKGLANVHRQIDTIVYLNVPRAELLKRLSGRYICRANQHVYNINTRPPKVPGVCDIDGSELYQRSDDTGEAVQRRLDIFFNETIHLLDYYGEQHKVTEINGNQSIEQVEKAILDAIDAQLEKK
jgi:adenylate kinase